MSGFSVYQEWLNVDFAVSVRRYWCYEELCQFISLFERVHCICDSKQI